MPLEKDGGAREPGDSGVVEVVPAGSWDFCDDPGSRCRVPSHACAESGSTTIWRTPGELLRCSPGRQPPSRQPVTN